MAYRQWLPNPAETIATRLTDDAMHPILPAGSIVAVDRSVTDPRKLHGQIVAARPGGVPMIRWLDISGRHVILRPNQHSGREFPLIPVEYDARQQLIIGQVVWSGADSAGLESMSGLLLGVRTQSGERSLSRRIEPRR